MGPALVRQASLIHPALPRGESALLGDAALPLNGLLGLAQEARERNPVELLASQALRLVSQKGSDEGTRAVVEADEGREAPKLGPAVL